MTQDEMSSRLPVDQESLQLETYILNLRVHIEKLEQQKKAGEDISLRLQELKIELESLEGQIEERSNSVANLDAVKKVLEASIADLQTMLSDIKESIDIARIELDRLKEAGAAEQEHLDEVLRLVENAQKQYIAAHTQLEEKLQAVKKSNQELETRIAEVDKEIAEKKVESNRISGVNQSALDEIDKHRSVLAGIKSEMIRSSAELESKRQELAAAHKEVVESCAKTIADSDARVAANKLEIEKILAEKSQALVEKVAAEAARDSARALTDKTFAERDAARKFIDEQEQTISLIKRNALLEVARIAKEQNVKIDKKFLEGILE